MTNLELDEDTGSSQAGKPNGSVATCSAAGSDMDEHRACARTANHNSLRWLDVDRQFALRVRYCSRQPRAGEDRAKTHSLSCR